MKKYFFIRPFIFLFLCAACIGGDAGRKGRPLAQDIASSSSDLCTELIDLQNFTCVSTCPAKAHVATQAELQQAFADDRNNIANNSIGTFQPTNPLSLEEKLQSVASLARGFCILDAAQDIRPDLSVKIQTDFCSCLNGKKDILNDCDNFCADKTHSEPILYVNTVLGADIQENAKLGNLQNWCNATLEDGNGEGAICRLKLQNGSSEFLLEVLNIANNNSFSVNIQQLPLNQTFVATLIEDGTGSNARSTSFQVRRIDSTLEETSITGPLRVSPIAMYTCLAKFGGVSADGQETTITDVQKIHYFYPLNNAPPALPPSSLLVDCHDVSLYGDDDGAGFPRLELISNQFTAWNESDIRFFDRDNNGKLDIHEIIEQRLRNEFNLVQTVNLFAEFRWPNRPNIGSEGSTQIAPRQGFIMQPSIEATSGRVFCPTQTDYLGNTPIFKILRDLIGVDTEGLYVGIREAQLLSDTSNNPQTSIPLQDILLIREGQLKKIWFYFENTLKLVPNELSSAFNTLHFYWPPDEVSPLTKKSHQKLYTIRRPEELGVSADQVGLRTNYPAPDKRFACIPKTN